MNNCMGFALLLEKSWIYTYSACVAHVYHLSYLLICATYICAPASNLAFASYAHWSVGDYRWDLWHMCLRANITAIKMHRPSTYDWHMS